MEQRRRRERFGAWFFAGALALAGCSRRVEPVATAGASAASGGPGASAAPARAPVRDDRPVAPLPPTRLPAAPRVVALGDVHGDLTMMRAALRLAGAIDEAHHWIGGDLVVVQTGDLLDRGDDERAILEWVPVLAEEARRAGGGFYALNGNHELMNVQGDFRYVTRGGFEDFRGYEGRFAGHPLLQRLPEHARSRAAAFAPGGTYARTLATLNTVLVVGDTAFVHGGLLEQHARFGLEELNRAVRAWVLGDREELPRVLEGEESPVWYRGFALRDDEASCALLERALSAARVRRLVIGHTVQDRGITSACAGKVWRIDVGLARYYRGPTQVLELRGDAVRALGTGLNAGAPGLGRDGQGVTNARVEGAAQGAHEAQGAGSHEHAGEAHDCASERPTRGSLWRS